MTDARARFEEFLDAVEHGLAERDDVVGLVGMGSTAERDRVDEWSESRARSDSLDPARTFEAAPPACRPGASPWCGGVSAGEVGARAPQYSDGFASTAMVQRETHTSRPCSSVMRMSHTCVVRPRVIGRASP